VQELEPDEMRAAPEQLSADLLARLLVPQRLDTDEGRILLAFLGLDNGHTGGAWLAQQELAESHDVSRDTVQRVLQ
jgi:hypothetical protein